MFTWFPLWICSSSPRGPWVSEGKYWPNISHLFLVNHCIGWQTFLVMLDKSTSSNPWNLCQNLFHFGFHQIFVNIWSRNYSMQSCCFTELCAAKALNSSGSRAIFKTASIFQTRLQHSGWQSTQSWRWTRRWWRRSHRNVTKRIRNLRLQRRRKRRVVARFLRRQTPTTPPSYTCQRWWSTLGKRRRRRLSEGEPSCTG